MPVYQYIDKKGKIYEDVRSVENRDVPFEVHGELLKRITIPTRFFVPVGVPSPIDGKAGALRGYKRLEERGKLRRGPKTYGMNAINKIWGNK
jgi:hypothetical protein